MSAFATCPAAPKQTSKLHSGLGCWQQRTYNFHLVPTHATNGFLYYRAGQRDARQLTRLGLVGAADGSEDLTANQNTGFVVADEGWRAQEIAQAAASSLLLPNATVTVRMWMQHNVQVNPEQWSCSQARGPGPAWRGLTSSLRLPQSW